MEIGVFGLLLIIGLGILWVEGTKTGSKFADWGLKNLCDIDINEVED